MRTALELLLAGFFLSGFLCVTEAGQSPWFFHVKTGGTGGSPVQSEADPGLAACWNRINAAFAAVKSGAKPGPWIIQVDDEATYDESVNFFDFQTSSTETLTLTKAPWLTGRPTIHPSQPKTRALLLNGLGPGSSGPLPGQPGQAARRITYFALRGFVLKNNAQGTDAESDQPLFYDNQTYFTEGMHTIEDCDFDGQNQVYDCRIAIFFKGTSINTIVRRNVFHHFKMREDPADTMFGYPSGSTYSTTENTEIIGFFNKVLWTTSAWNGAAKKTGGILSFLNRASMSNTNNGYPHGGLSLDQSRRLLAGSLCIDRGVPGLVSDDLDGGLRTGGQWL